ncbi:hypothetical protein BO78DRAFT_43012 [Aspergillus sclerotiicarbonarius CBS 121057]|uniref:Uncharacterized protein n=1 Tax=Aspergillus sclerotiicarbonarius (strain CBS 121057 / IBT 28362) TaxID=1448318 RepID=A0A319DRU9_ASPSB|nr:hypothetical protein BO78DRAFT_43012 [Aspergillus sclerotiicarbonarius CBS 121057]
MPCKPRHIPSGDPSFYTSINIWLDQSPVYIYRPRPAALDPQSKENSTKPFQLIIKIQTHRTIFSIHRTISKMSKRDKPNPPSAEMPGPSDPTRAPAPAPTPPPPLILQYTVSPNYVFEHTPIPISISRLSQYKVGRDRTKSLEIALFIPEEGQNTMVLPIEEAESCGFYSWEFRCSKLSMRFLPKGVDPTGQELDRFMVLLAERWRNEGVELRVARGVEPCGFVKQGQDKRAVEVLRDLARRLGYEVWDRSG